MTSIARFIEREVIDQEEKIKGRCIIWLDVSDVLTCKTKNTIFGNNCTARKYSKEDRKKKAQ